jgi:hypothetical protein
VSDPTDVRAEYSDLETLVAPETLARLIGPGARRLQRTVTPIPSGSNATFVALGPEHGAEPRLLVKRLPAGDWIAEATEDPGCREVALWRRGVLARLPWEVATPVLACARDGAGWAILMRDLGDVWLGDAPLTQAQHESLLAGVAGLHAAFWDDPEIADPRLGLCTLERYLGMFAPETCRRLARRPDDFHAVAWLGWEALGDVLDPPLAARIRELIADPRPLCATLRRLPQTLVHGDVGPGNVGLLGGEPPRAVVIDWQLATRGPAGLDLASYLMDFAPLLPEGPDHTIARYQALLTRRLGRRVDAGAWPAQWELAALGAFVRMAWAYAYHIARDADHRRRRRFVAELGWWSELARSALRRL